VLQTCRELGIGFMAYAPLGRGFLTGTMKTLDALLPKDRRRDHPRFAPENIGRNAELLTPIEQIAAAHKATPAQVAIAWLLAQGEDIVPIPGTKRREYLEQNCAAADLKLSADEVGRLKKAFPMGVTAGTRYPEKQLAGLGI
jgi:aryl-alcohol dehydrogenase-like predicted oxidoreductase